LECSLFSVASEQELVRPYKSQGRLRLTLWRIASRLGTGGRCRVGWEGATDVVIFRHRRHGNIGCNHTTIYLHER